MDIKKFFILYCCRKAHTNTKVSTYKIILKKRRHLNISFFVLLHHLLHQNFSKLFSGVGYVVWNCHNTGICSENIIRVVSIETKNQQMDNNIWIIKYIMWISDKLLIPFLPNIKQFYKEKKIRYLNIKYEKFH
ncbi:hypothetical protein BpHYR1_035840 [Brachionus plicatilis]|uniref:Uncharacterized protein n=1 Tax=Brachionus plicatilis TaxID=10195 RepID=A0A3M7PDL8_BRAPC|nr:hypothetical protein BpHYR1_035840 [Brachionus plicatilis]